ncbi:MAG TPA: pitrilysin family protein [Bacillota bacterium]|nr:pitrilysin family protein [Bacillota bacterium]
MNKKTYDHIDETLYKEVLPNGLTVFLLPRPEMAKTYSVFTTNYGGKDHTFIPLGKNEKITAPEGVAHFLEHKLFEKEDGTDVFLDFGKQGASANAYTSATETAYLFSATDHIKENVVTLLDFVQEPFFTDESVEREQDIIVQELQMYLDQADHRSYMGILQAMFKEHPVRNEILGTEESIRSTTREDLLTSYHTFYHPNNMTFFIAGNFDVEEMATLIRENQAAKTFAAPEDIQRFPVKESKEVAKKESRIHMPIGTPKVVVGVKEYGEKISTEEFEHRDMLQDMIISHFFGANGPLYKELYENGYIDRSFSVQSTIETDHGFTILSGNSDQPDVLAGKVKELLLSTNDYEISEESFDRMKKKRIGQLLRAMNSLEFIAGEFVHYHMNDLDFFDVLPKIQELTLEEVNTYIQEWITEEQLAVCIVESE